MAEENIEPECTAWLKEVLAVFPKLSEKNITAEYSDLNSNSTSAMNYDSHLDYDFDPEALLVGDNTTVKEKKICPGYFKILVNSRLKRIRTPLLRKQVVQHDIMHHLLTIEEQEKAGTTLEGKKKRVVTKSKKFEKKLFEKYNQFRQAKGIAKIEKAEHLEAAIHRVLHTINWRQ